MSERLAVVTGASAGLGKTLARTLLERGWHVLGLARRDASLHGDRYRHERIDLADFDAVESYFTQRFPRDHDLAAVERVALVNNAGVLEPVGLLGNVSLADLARAMAVNATAPAWLAGYFLRHARRTRLRILDISSGSATNAKAGWAAYCMSKAALRMAGLVLAEEAQTPGEGGPARDVAIISYAPGMLDTEMQQVARSARPADFPGVQRFIDVHARGELIPPERPTLEMAELLERDDLPLYSELRYTP
ncbi:MAG: SDR family NAD(P)-dependent oxidoreductase [Candidatus Lambdaproteobacteria bacterium]|nr:SDR family NAD(P)-dependent oxidoreductase [Candidatus Lambdaproteobacteria bacterium]